MFEHSKPKNDEKSKRRPNQTLLIAMMIGALLVAVCALIIVVNLTGTDANGLPTARLLYTNQYRRVSLNLQTGEKTILNESAPKYGASKLSPDGKWIASWRQNDESSPRVLNLQDAKILDMPQPLGIFVEAGSTLTGGGGTLNWSPDSQQILFTAFPDTVRRSENQELWLYNISTKALTRLTNNQVTDRDGVFSPDGMQIAYTSTADGYNRLYVMDVVSGQSRLVSPDTFGYGPAWSPDGTWIAFHTNHQGPNSDIWIIRADGTGAQAITTDDSEDSSPAWLP